MTLNVDLSAVSNPAVLRALEKLADQEVRIHSVTKAKVALPNDGGVLRLFPNCTALSNCASSDGFRDSDLISDLNEFIRNNPQMQLHDLSLSVWYRIPSMTPHLHTYAESLRTISIDGGLRSTPADELVNALCQCKMLNVFKSSEYALRTVHVLQLLSSRSK